QHLRCPRVLVDGVARFADVLQDDRLDRGRNISRHADIDMRLDAGANPQRLQTLAERLAQIAWQLSRFRTDVGQQPAKRVLDFSQGVANLIELRTLVTSV